MTRIPRPKLVHPRYEQDAEISKDRYEAHRNVKGLLQAVISLVIGMFIAAGGSARWKNQSLEVAMGFPWAPMILGGILIFGSTILWCAVIADNARLRWYGCIICGAWHYTMMIFAVWKFATTPTTVDDVAFFLWFFLATDYMLSAVLSVTWDSGESDSGGK